jgi:hypothetical protein
MATNWWWILAVLVVLIGVWYAINNGKPKKPKLP